MVAGANVNTSDTGAYASVANGILPAANAYGITAGNLQHWRKAKANARAGVASGKLLVVGDSTSYGYPNSTAQGHSWPGRLATMLNSFHVPALASVANLSAKNGGPDGKPDSRVVLGTAWSWTPSTGLGQGDRGGVVGTVGSTGDLTFAPGYNFDTIVLYYIEFSNKGTVTVNINGGASLATIDASVGTGIGVTSVSATRGVNTIHVTPPTGAGKTDFNLLAIEAYDSTVPAVRVINLGVDGSTAANNGGVFWADDTAAYSAAYTINAVAPDLTVIMLGINDSGYATGVAAYTAAINKLVAYAQNFGDVLLCSFVPSNPSVNANYSTESQYVAALASIAGAPSASPSLAYVDIWNHFGASHTELDNLGYYADAGVHPNDQGYADIADCIYTALAAV